MRKHIFGFAIFSLIIFSFADGFCVFLRAADSANRGSQTTADLSKGKTKRKTYLLRKENKGHHLSS